MSTSIAMDYYPYNRRVLRGVCGLTSFPDRRTFDRRLSTISVVDIKERISSMGSLFAKQKLVDPYIIATDSTLLRARGRPWHKSSINDQRSSTMFRYRY